jgi:hypothetical protein
MKRIQNIRCVPEKLVYSNDMSSTISPARSESIARFNAAIRAWDGQAYLAASVAHAADIERITSQDAEAFAADLAHKSIPKSRPKPLP